MEIALSSKSFNCTFVHIPIIIGISHISCYCRECARCLYQNRFVDPPLLSLSPPPPPFPPISRFFTRNGGFLSFTLDTGLPVNTSQYSLPPARRLVAYIFHPFEPFVISIQKTSTTDYVVCFHIRNIISCV